MVTNRMKTNGLFTVFALLPFVAALGCEKKEEVAASEERVNAAVSGEDEKAAPERPEEGAAGAQKGRTREVSPVSPQELGVLPSGVGVAVGETAPNATVEDDAGKPVELASLFERGSVLLVFYRGGWCPYCSFQIHELARALPEYRKRGVTPVAISVDRPEEASKSKATYAIEFPVLSDPELSAHRAYRVVHQADDAEVARLKGLGIDLERASGEDHHSFAIPAMFLIDGKGEVLWAHANADYKKRPRTEQVLGVIDAVRAKGT